MNRSRTFQAVVTTTLIMFLGTGCGSSSERTEPKMTDRTASALPSDAAASAATDILAIVGLSLPSGATDVTVELVDNPPYENASVTTFRSSRADAVAMCEAAGGYAAPTTSIPPIDATLLGGFTPAEGSLAAWQFPAASNLYVNIAPGEPALVTVLIYTVPSR